MCHFRHWLSSSWGYALALLFVGVASYALLVNRLGFYWDDWQAIYLERAHDVGLAWNFFAHDRPVSTWTFALLLPVFGANPAAWHIATLVIRWLAVLCFVLAFIELFPARRGLMRWMGFLAMVYPGFPLQAVSVAFSQHFLTLLCYSASLLFMLWFAQRRGPRYLWLVLGFFTCLVQLFTMEYFTALELLRPLILWIFFFKPGEPFLSLARKVVKIWAWFLIPLIAYITFRFGLYTRIFNVGESHPLVLADAFLSSPLEAALRLGTAILQDTLQMVLFNWVSVFGPETVNLKALATIFSWLAGLGTALICVYLYKLDENPPAAAETAPDKFNRWVLLLASAIIFLGELPVWMIGRQITQGKWSERFTLGPMLGIALLMVLVIEWLVRTKRQKQVALLLLLGFSIAAQIRTTNKFRLDWEIQRNYYWQLSWRAPNLAPHTAILSDGVSSNFVSSFSVGFGLNTVYAHPPIGSQLNYWFFTPKPGDPAFSAQTPASPINYQFRNLSFKGSSSQSLVVSYAPAVGCVRIVTPASAADPVLRDAAHLAGLTNLQRIRVESPVTLDPLIFGMEPAHAWCYYYEKADLALQRQDWNQVIRLMNEAGQKGFAPKTGGELLPLMDAYVQTGAWEQAYQTSLQAQSLTIDIEPLLCSAWQRYAAVEGGKEKAAAIEKSLITFNCAPNQ